MYILNTVLRRRRAWTCYSNSDYPLPFTSKQLARLKTS